MGQNGSNATYNMKHFGFRLKGDQVIHIMPVMWAYQDGVVAVFWQVDFFIIIIAG